MKPIILYKSHTGYTGKYAKMLSKKLACEALSLDKIRSINLSDYDTIIFGGAVRASVICGLKKLFRYIHSLEETSPIIFAVGANEKSESNTTELFEKNLKEAKGNLPLFYLQGGFDPERLNFLLKAMLKGVAGSLKKKEEKDPASLSEKEREFIRFFQDSYSDIKEENLNEILTFIEGSQE